MENILSTTVVPIETNRSIWDRVFTVHPLVVIGTKDESGNYNLAPKHMAMPLGWHNYFTFVCCPTHTTYQNIKREHEFTVSYPQPCHIVHTALAAAPRCDDDLKPGLANLEQLPAEDVDATFLKDSYLYLECRLHSIIDNFGENSLIIGHIIAAYANKQSVRFHDQDDHELIHKNPILAYLNPGRYTIISSSQSFPFPKGFKR